MESGKGRILAGSFIGFIGEWKYALLDVGSNSDSFRVMFEAEAGNGAKDFGGVIAIDDVSFTDSCTDGKVILIFFI